MSDYPSEWAEELDREQELRKWVKFRDEVVHAAGLTHGMIVAPLHSVGEPDVSWGMTPVDRQNAALGLT